HPQDIEAKFFTSHMKAHQLQQFAMGLVALVTYGADRKMGCVHCCLHIFLLRSVSLQPYRPAPAATAFGALVPACAPSLGREVTKCAPSLPSWKLPTIFCRSSANPERSWQAFADCWAPTADSFTSCAIWSMLLFTCSVALDCSVAAVAMCVIISPTWFD